MPGEVERLRTRLRLLSDSIASFVSASSDYQRLLPAVASAVSRTVSAACIVLLLDKDDVLVPAAIHDDDPEVVAGITRDFAARFDPRFSRQVLATGKGIVIPVVDRSKLPPEQAAFFERIKLCGIAVMPMRMRGEPIGVLAVVRHTTPGDPPLDELDGELVQDLANHAALAIANARMVEQLRDSERVQRAERFLDTVIEHIPDMVFVKDAEKLAFTRFNRAGEELLGVPREQLLGKTDFDFFPPAEAEFFQAKDRETLRMGALVDIPEEPIQTASGQRWLHTKKVPILDPAGQPLYLLGISQDITARRQAAAELRRAKEDAERASKELEAFSYSVAHDLRAPLRGIDGFSQALIEDYGDKLDAEGRRFLDRLRDSAQRMAMLIDDLLALSKVTRSELAVRRVDVSALAETVVASLRRLDPGRSIEIAIEPGLRAMADPRLLEIALENLMSNAWKFTAKTAAPRVELCTVERAGQTWFAVRDNGAGFDMAYANKLFGVFQRLHTEVEFPGTGIGLATVARIIHRHRGQVAAEGSPGTGAAFYFRLGTEAV